MAVIGHLNLLWWWALDYAPDGDLSRYEAADLADAADWEGDPYAFVDAFLTCGTGDQAGFLERTDDGRLLIHDWWDYAGRLIERREANADRMRARRAQHHARNGHVSGDPEGPSDTTETRAAHVQDTTETRTGATVPTVTTEPSRPESADALSSSAIAADAAPRPEETPAEAGEPDPGFRVLSNALAKRIRQNNPKARSPSPRQLARWDNTVRLMVERDGRPLSDIRAVLDWSQDDEFWRTNILSMDALRQHYDRLWVKMHTPSRANPNVQPAEPWWEQRDDSAWRAAHPYTAAVMDATPGRAPPETPDPDTPMNRSAADRSRASPEERAP